MSSDGIVILGLVILALIGQFVWFSNRLRVMSAELETLRRALQRAEGPAEPVGMAPAPPPAPATTVPPPPPREAPPPVMAAETVRHHAAELSRQSWPSQARDKPEPAFERALTTRWLVWLGGVTLAVGGLFLARYAVEHGILGPAARMTLGGLFGLALIGAGEWLVRRPIMRKLGFLPPDQVPVALVAAGLSILFAVIYASHTLHGLIGTGTTFTLLAASCLAGFPLALRHGAFVALLGYAGGMLLPVLLVEGPLVTVGNAMWIMLLLAALFTVAARLGAAGLSLAGCLFHGYLTMRMLASLDGLSGDAGLVWIPTILLLLPPLALALVERAQWTRPARFGQACLLMAVLALFTIFGFVMIVGPGLPLWILSVVLGTLFGWLGRVQGPRTLLWLAGAILNVGLCLWGLVVLPAEASALTPLFCITLAHLAVSLAGVLRAARPMLAALCGVAAPVLLSGAVLELLWVERGMTMGLPVILPLLAAAGFALTAPPLRMLLAGLSRLPEQAGRALELYGVMGLFLLAVLPAFWLKDAALTLALALLVSLGVVLARGLAASALRDGAGLLVGVVLARFLMNEAVLDYPLSGPVHWPLWAMGGAAAALYLASRLSRPPVGQDQGTLPEGLLVAALLLAVAAVTLEIRIWTEGGLRSDGQRLLEVSLRGLAWLGAGLTALMRGQGRWLRLFGGLLTGLALLQVMVLQLLALNPLCSAEGVGSWPLLNLLALAYLLPALALLVARGPVFSQLPVKRSLFDALALVLLLAYALLSVRQAFHGSIIALDVAGSPGEWEMYCYSGVGLLASLVLILLGIRTGRADIRSTAVGILLLTVAKVFLLDMSDLSGIPRILSFLGLGFSLIGIGWIYQRFVFPRPVRREVAADQG